MNINFTPISMFDNYSLSVSGDSIIINGQSYTLPELASNAEAGQPMPKFVVTALGDSVTLLLPYWGDTSQTPYTLDNPPDGPIVF